MSEPPMFPPEKMVVIIPVFNSMKTLPKLLQSIKKADTSECNILFVDDCSSDGSCEYLEKQGFKVYQMPSNQGPAAARNAGMEITDSPLIMLADSDVVIHSPEAFSAMIRTFENKPEVNSVSTISLPIPENKSIIAKYTALNEYISFDRFIRGKSEVANWPDISTRFGAFRREVLQAVDGFDTKFPFASVEDADLFYRIQEKGHRGHLLAWLKIGHHWPEKLLPLAKAWIIRAFLWSRLFAKRKKFDQVFTTARETALKAFDLFTFGFLLLTLLFNQLWPITLMFEIMVLLFKMPLFWQFFIRHDLLTAICAVFLSRLNSIALGIGALGALIYNSWKAMNDCHEQKV
jgi:glycosyltransferase involved in cell wall biosynthesis